MFTHMNGNENGKSIVEDYYEAEEHNAGYEVESTKMTVKLSVNAFTMFNAVCSRFGNTRFQLLESHFDVLASQMFGALSESDKVELAKLADKEATEILKKQGLTSWFSTGAAGSFENESASWRHYLAMSKIPLSKEDEKEGAEC